MEENKSLKLQEEKSIEQTSVSDSLPEVCSLSSHLIGGDDNPAVSEQSITGKPWLETLYSTTSWKEHPHPSIFLQGVPLTVKLEATKRLGRVSHPVGHVIYQVNVEHGQWRWSVEKRFHNFTWLHTNITFFRGKEQLRSGMFRGLNRMFDLDNPMPQLPRFPGRPDTMMTSPEHLEERRAALEVYLNTVLEQEMFREQMDVVSFLEVSRLSFVCGGAKGKEGWVKKRHGDSRQNGCCKWQHCVRCQLACCAQMATQWGKRWFMVQDTFIMYINTETGEIKEVFLFDSDTRVGLGFKEAGTRKGFSVRNLSRTLVVKSLKRRWAESWVEAIKKSMEEGPGREITSKNKRFESFAPVRQGVAAWYVDGCDYMASVAEAISKAKEEIFLTDWWLSPEVYLKRGLDREGWRLTTLLRRKAEEGVRISILLYKEVAAVLGINSMYSKKRMLQHPLIRVIRHPDHSPMPIMWAHHEKCVIVDQSTAFIGGIDLCFGRWDTHSHRLTDVGSAPDSKQAELNRTTSGSSLLEGTKIVNSSRPTTASQAIQSVTMQLLAQHCVLDVALAPVRSAQGEQEEKEEKNQAHEKPEKKTLRKSARSVMLKVKTMKKIRGGNESDDDSLCSDDDTLPDGALLSRKKAQIKSPDGELTWPGKDYVNWIVRDLNQPELADLDNADRLTTPRMPWHDIGLALEGDAARDVARHFIQRWNHLKTEKLRYNPKYTFLVPKAYSPIFNPERKSLLKNTTPVQCQVVRSCSTWSAGQDLTEFSIMQALVQTIAAAQHYIYIENQFFISYVKTGDNIVFSDVKNDIATALFERIVKAHKSRETFRVYILLPLLPAFEGDIAGDSGSGMRAIMYYQYQSISRGKNSLIYRLEMEGIQDWQKYIGFYSLRTHDELKSVPVTELVYIHSKLCIVDDKTVICGSANINDRSLLGDRDSELCLYIEDKEFVEGRMNGQPYKCGKFAGGMRKHLFREHLGLLEKQNNDIDITDPVADTFYNDVWNYIAKTNTILYDELFAVLPTDSITTRKASKELQTKVRPLVETFGRDVKQRLSSIRGTLVQFPTQYLCQEDLQPASMAKEGMVPQELWK